MHRSDLNNDDAGRLPFSHYKLIRAMLFLLSIVMIHSCGIGPSSTPDPSPQQQPSQEVAHPFHTTTKTSDGAFTITLDITPDRTGTNVFTAHVMDNLTGKTTTQVQITLYTTMQDMAMGTNSISLQDDGKGQFSATGDNLSMAGHWAVGITIQTADHIIHKVGVSFVTFP